MSTAAGWAESELDALEAANPDGMSVQQIVEAFASRGEKLTEATFRKYVQLGLLPRSVRVGRKGKHRGSQGLYPSSAVRQIDLVRRLMAQGYTIEEIQKEFLFVRGEIDALVRQLERVHRTLTAALRDRERAASGVDYAVSREVADAKALGDQLIEKLESIERRLSMRARMARAAV
jgi:hypothetical protein